MSYLHVGMVQHDPAGRIAFLHRTAEGKFHPLVRAFRRVHVVTVPLSPARAAATLGNRQRHMGFESLQARRPRNRACARPDVWGVGAALLQTDRKVSARAPCTCRAAKHEPKASE